MIKNTLAPSACMVLITKHFRVCAFFISKKIHSLRRRPQRYDSRAIACSAMAGEVSVGDPGVIRRREQVLLSKSPHSYKIYKKYDSYKITTGSPTVRQSPPVHSNVANLSIPVDDVLESRSFLGIENCTYIKLIHYKTSIKNTLALSAALALCTTSYCSAPKITVSDFSPHTIEKLQVFSSLHKGPFTIEIMPDQSWAQSTKDFFTSKIQSVRDSLSFKNVCISTFAMLMSLGWVSYVICAYILYKGYCMVEHATSWLNWCSDDELLSLDQELLYQRLLDRKRSYITTNDPVQSIASMLEAIRTEKTYIGYCIQIEQFLKKHTTNHFIPYANAVSENRLQSSYRKLVLAEEFLTHGYLESEEAAIEPAF